jgi:hypothetical protein
LAEAQTCSGGGLGIEGVRGVNPGTDTRLTGEFGEERQSKRRAAGGFRSGELADGTDGESAVEESVDLGDAGGDGIAEGARLWG